MENTCGYSNEWQPYLMEYDKYEYDIMLHDESIIPNCLPNAGEFFCIAGENYGKSVSEDLVMKIRFSENPVAGINDDDDVYSISGEYLLHKHPPLPTIDLLATKPLKGRLVSVRTVPKVGRNEACPCGSGKKHKKCCL